MTYALVTGAVAAVIAALLGGPLISFLRAQGLAKSISADGPESHLSKAGTPTMGGLLIFGVGLGAALVAGVPKDGDILLPIIVAAVVCAIGVYDDLGTLINRGQREAHDRTGMIMKLVGFAGVAAVAAWVLYDQIEAPRLLIPTKGAYDIGPFYIVVAMAVIISVTSAVGVTDGIDGLAGGTSAVAYTAFGAIALMQHQAAVATFAFAMVGSLVGYLYWNAYPARLFMGDAGSLPLGAGLAVLALMTGWWVLVPVIGIVFVIEILSVVIQIGSYRLRGGKRVFRMAPIHHHFEKLGWHEVTVTVRFVGLGVVGALVGVALAGW
jgi:phospho-N-acetylmuramoyl-pentapeptide-transferase